MALICGIFFVLKRPCPSMSARHPVLGGRRVVPTEVRAAAKKDGTTGAKFSSRVNGP